MIESSRSTHTLPHAEHELEISMDTLQRALGAQAVRNQADPYNSSYMTQALEEIREERPFGILLERFAAHRPIRNGPTGKGLTASNAINITRSLVHYDMLERRGSNFYEGLETPEGWQEPMTETAIDILQRHSSLSDELSFHFLTSRLQTTLGDRYGTLDLYLQIMREELGDNLSVLDGGCSLLLGSNQLVLKDQFPFSTVTVTEPVRSIRNGNDSGNPNYDLTDAVNELRRRPTQVGKSHGVDIMDPASPITRKWATASLRIPGELNNPEFMHTFNQLVDEKPSNVDYAIGDITNPLAMTKFDEKFHGQKYDIIFFSTVANQFSQQEWNNALMMAQRYGKPKTATDSGVRILVQDFAYTHGSKLNFYVDWYRRPFRFRLHEIDPETGKSTEVLRARNGRCTELAVHAGKITLKGRQLPTAQVILSA